jgi:lysophospholipase L1-like esterase
MFRLLTPDYRLPTAEQSQFRHLTYLLTMPRHSTILLFLLFIAAACSKNKEPEAVITPPVVNPGPVDRPKTYLALGDSYTIGQSVDFNQRFPVQTKAWLNQQGINMYDPRFIAVTGWSTIALQQAITTENPVGPFDVVSLLIGVNDQYQGLDTASYRKRFGQLLQKAISLAGNRASHVFVLSIPDYSVTPFARNSDTARIRKQLDDFNNINRQITLAASVPYLDITLSSREARYNLSLIASDSLHFSGIEYAKWAERLGVMMKPVLQ